MIESNFEYTENLIKKINTSSTKKYNLVIEISIFMILLGVVVLFVTGNTILGLIGCVIFIMLLISLLFANISITKSNHTLIGQQVNIVFNDTKMVMTTRLGDRVLYRANFDYNAITDIKHSGDLMIIHFNKISAVIIPKTSFKTSQDCKKAIELMGNNYVM